MGCAASSSAASIEPAPTQNTDAATDKNDAKTDKKGSNRRLSMTGGPQGAKATTANDNARRRRLSVATGPSADARQVVQENSAVLSKLPSGDLNIPVITNGKAAALPIRWAEYSRPGNDPMKRVKENQDSVIVVDKYGDRPNQMFFGVFDGHGPNGGLASQYIRDHLPASWLQGNLDPDPFVSINQGCIITNQALHMSHIDVYVSGTTAITSLLRDNHLYVANVGDSRAVLGRASASSGTNTAAAPTIKALDLSNDQKPDRPDEMARILATGGRVFEWGVPRVWMKDVDMPGLAMSRSMGDIAAETVGVFAEPELAEVALGKNDKFIIWASDGVWEFISSQEAVDIVAQYLDKTPVEAAGALVRESTKRWGEEEDVVDDSTCIVAFLNFT